VRGRSPGCGGGQGGASRSQVRGAGTRAGGPSCCAVGGGRPNTGAGIGSALGRSRLYVEDLGHDAWRGRGDWYNSPAVERLDVQEVHRQR
jgi:hypothetical protein